MTAAFALTPGLALEPAAGRSVHQRGRSRARSGRCGGGTRGRGRPPGRRPRPPRPDLGDPARHGGDLLAGAAPERARGVVAVAAAARGAHRGQGPHRAGLRRPGEVAQRRAPGRRPQGRRHPRRAGGHPGGPGRDHRRRDQRHDDRRGACRSRRPPAWRSPHPAPPTAPRCCSRWWLRSARATTCGRPAARLGTARLATSYRSHCATLGRDVRVDLPGGGALSGRAVDVDPDGRLVVETANGTERVGAGDVVHVRATD
ncbi:hypothetical protein G5V59_24075 [Nocardioides sp. W3-2-3]|nr:hypothetical protein [Nocardioides convexus]